MSTRWCLMVSAWISLMSDGTKHLFTCLFASWIFSLGSDSLRLLSIILALLNLGTWHPLYNWSFPPVWLFGAVYGIHVWVQAWDDTGMAAYFCLCLNDSLSNEIIVLNVKRSLGKALEMSLPKHFLVSTKVSILASKTLFQVRETALLQWNKTESSGNQGNTHVWCFSSRDSWKWPVRFIKRFYS